MSIANKLLQVNQVKQDIKAAIETKGIPMTNVAFTEYANKILDISGGGGEVDEYFYYAKSYYTITGNSALFSNAWQDSKDSETVLFDIPLELVATEQEMGGMLLDVYVGTNSELERLYNDCLDGLIPQHTYLVNNQVLIYGGDISDDMGFPNPVFLFGISMLGEILGLEGDKERFIIADITPLQTGLGIVLGKWSGNLIPNNKVLLQEGFVYGENGVIIPNSVTSIGVFAFRNWTSNNKPLVIPNSVTSIGDYAFYDWTSNNQPLVIPNSVTSIRDSTFYNWTSNNHPLVIPNSVTSIGYGAFRNWTSNNHPLVIPNSVTIIGYEAFRNWTSNNHPLVIPDSVTSIGDYAFRNWPSVPYIEIQPTIPPTLVSSSTFENTNNAPIYVPDESVDDYKTATNWVNLANRIFPISSKE